MTYFDIRFRPPKPMKATPASVSSSVASDNVPGKLPMAQPNIGSDNQPTMPFAMSSRSLDATTIMAAPSTKKKTLVMLDVYVAMMIHCKAAYA